MNTQQSTQSGATRGEILYQRFQVLHEHWKVNAGDTEAQKEMNEIQHQVESDPILKAEFTQAAQVGKKPVVERSYDLGAVVDKATKGFGVFNAHSRDGQREVQEKADAIQAASNEYKGKPIVWGWGGVAVDFWSDLIEGQGEQQEAFILAYRKIIWGRNIDGIMSRPAGVHAGGGLGRYQLFEIFRWKIAKAALRTERMGDDLYISWRVFVGREFSWLRFILWLIGCLLVAIFMSVGLNFQLYQTECTSSKQIGQQRVENKGDISDVFTLNRGRLANTVHDGVEVSVA